MDVLSRPLDIFCEDTMPGAAAATLPPWRVQAWRQSATCWRWVADDMTELMNQVEYAPTPNIVLCEIRAFI